MKKYLLFVFILIPYFLFSYTIEETLQQIESLKKEISHNEQVVEQKIADLKESNPFFAEQDPFESDTKYLGRMSKAMPQIDRLRKQYLGDLWKKMSILRGRLFETKNIIIELDSKKYDANNEVWSFVVEHLDYQKEHILLNIKVSKQDARTLYEHKDKLQVTGILAVDIGDKIGLAKLKLKDPISGINIIHEIQPMKTFKHKDNVNSVAFSPDGKFLATGCDDDYAHIFNLETGKEVKSFKHKDHVNSVAFSPDGKFLATCSNECARIFNFVAGNEELSFEKIGYLRCIIFSPDGKFLAIGSGDDARLFNLETGKEVKSFEDENFVKSIAFRPDGKFIATGSGDIHSTFGYSRIFNLETGQEIKSFYHKEPVNTVSFSPDGKFLATSTSSYMKKGYTRIFNLENGKEVKSFKGELTFDFSSDGKFLATGSNNGKAMIINLESGNKVKYFEHNKSVKTVAFSPDDKYLAVCCSYDDNVYIYRTFAQIEDKILAKKIISRPPSLTASVIFSELSGNQYLDALEKGEISVTVINTGKGSGKGITIKFDPERIEGLNYNNSYIDEIPEGKEVTVKIPVEAYIDVKEATQVLRINFEEINGFPPAPVEIEFSTKAYQKPKMFIVDIGIEDNNNNGMIESGETTKLTVRIGNKGKGVATGAYAKFYAEDNVFITDSFPQIVSLGDLEYNQHIDVPLEFFVNDKAPDEIPLYVDLTEATGIAGVDHLRIPIKKSERTRKIKRTVIAGIDKYYGDLEFGDDLSIDVEQNIPVTKKSNKKALAVIFGIENYRNISNVNFAYRDASFMKEYFSKTIGIPEELIYLRANEEVTLGEFNKIFSDNGWLDKRVFEEETDIFVYYAGHGAPAIKEEKAFLIPFDGDPNYPVQTGYSLDMMFENLSKLNANSVTVFLDACFTGANRENEMLLTNARPISIQLKNNYVNNVTVFSATSSNEISSSYPINKHGLFSYFLMKGMQGEADKNKDKKLTIKELFEYTKENVSKTAGTLDREQTPQLQSIEPERIIINY